MGLFASTHHYQSLSAQLLAMALHCMWLFPLQVKSMFGFFHGTELDSFKHEQLRLYVAASTQKIDIFNLYSEPAVCCQRLDTLLLLLLLSRRGRAPLLNASVLTSIMTVSRIEKPSRQISFSTHWWLSEVASDATHPKQFKAAANINTTLPPCIHYLRRTLAWHSTNQLC